MKKIKTKKGLTFAILFATALISAVAFIIYLMVASYHLREFKVDMFVVCNESSVCVAEGPDGRVRMDPENVEALYVYLNGLKGRQETDTSNILDTLTYNFKCHDENWVLTMNLLPDDIMQINLEGPRSYTVFTDEMGYFDKCKQVASLNGLHAKNKPFGN